MNAQEDMDCPTPLSAKLAALLRAVKWALGKWLVVWLVARGALRAAWRLCQWLRR